MKRVTPAIPGGSPCLLYTVCAYVDRFLALRRNICSWRPLLLCYSARFCNALPAFIQRCILVPLSPPLQLSSPLCANDLFEGADLLRDSATKATSSKMEAVNRARSTSMPMCRMQTTTYRVTGGKKSELTLTWLEMCAKNIVTTCNDSFCSNSRRRYARYLTDDGYMQFGGCCS